MELDADPPRRDVYHIANEPRLVTLRLPNERGWSPLKQGNDMTKLNDEICELNSDQLDQVSGGWYRERPQPHFRNPEMQLEYEMQGQFNAMNSALKGFTMPSIF